MLLITGGTGFVGRHLVHALAGDGRPIRALVRGDSPRQALPSSVHIARGDLTDSPAVVRALDGVAAVIHLAASLPGTPDAAAAFRRDVESTRLLARAARQAGVRTFVHVSSAGVYGAATTAAPMTEEAPLRAQSPYERSKLESETAVRDELSGGDTAWVILRPPGIYGPGRPQTLDFLRQVRRRPVWLHGRHRVIVHPVHVDDVVDAIRTVLARDDARGEVFNVGGERPIVYQELIALVGRLLPCRVYQVSLPAAGVINRSVDSSKAAARLGFRPRLLTEGMAQSIDAFRADGRL
jgi:nucleoside-diphosphate-sugar epimerase